MKLFSCCFNFKRRKNKNKKNTELTNGNNTTNVNIIDISNENNSDTANVKTIENLDNEKIELSDINNEGNISLNTSEAAVTALSYAPPAEEHSYYVIDYTNVSSLERDRLQDKYDSLQNYSPSPSTAPSLYSKKSATDFQSAVSINSTESFFTTASSLGNNDNDKLYQPFSKHSSYVSNSFYATNTTNVDNKNDSTFKTFSHTNLKSMSSRNSMLSKNSVFSKRFSKSKVNTSTDTNETKNNLYSTLKRENEISFNSTDITVRNLEVKSLNNSNNIKNNDNNNNNTVETKTDATSPLLSKRPSTVRFSISKLSSVGRINSNLNDIKEIVSKDNNIVKSSSSILPTLSKHSSRAKLSISRISTASSLTLLNEVQLNNIAERALHPDLTNYTLYSTIKKRIKVYTRIRPSTGINEYIILGYLDNVTLREAYDVYMDLEYRKEWDDLEQQINIFNRKDKNGSQDIKNDLKDLEIHWEIKLPWPFSNREYVFERNTYEHKYNNMVFLITDNNSLHDKEENNNNSSNQKLKTIRITEYEQTTVFYSDSEDGKCNVYMEYYDDPKGNIPLVLKNWVVAKAAPSFVMNIEKACKEYKTLEKRLKNNKHIRELNDLLGNAVQEAFDNFEF